MERTLSIIKPDAVEAGHSDKIMTHLVGEGFKILSVRRMRLTEAQARAFYEVHKERPFYESLVEFMTSGTVVVLALEREDAVRHLRQVMGATNSEEAEEGTIRNLYGTSIERNAIHGSDSPENASKELAFFFSTAELLSAS